MNKSRQKLNLQNHFSKKKSYFPYEMSPMRHIKFSQILTFASTISASQANTFCGESLRHFYCLLRQYSVPLFFILHFVSIIFGTEICGFFIYYSVDENWLTFRSRQLQSSITKKLLFKLLYVKNTQIEWLTISFHFSSSFVYWIYLTIDVKNNVVGW